MHLQWELTKELTYHDVVVLRLCRRSPSDDSEAGVAHGQVQLETVETATVRTQRNNVSVHFVNIICNIHK